MPFSRLSQGETHYVDVFSTLSTNADGSEREINHFLPRAQARKLLATGERHSNDLAKLTLLSKELSVSLDLLEQCVKHLEDVKILSEIRSRERARKMEKRDVKTYEDYN